MKKDQLKRNSSKNPLLVRIIDNVINALLYLSLIVVFVVVFRKFLGDSEIAHIASIIVGLILASATITLIKRNAKSFIVLLLFTVPAFALALAFLFI